MTTDTTLGYWSRRARDERALAERAESPAVRRIHLFMAERYRRWIERTGR